MEGVKCGRQLPLLAQGVRGWILGRETPLELAIEWAKAEWRSRGLSENTIDAYVTYVRELSSFLGSSTRVGEVTEGDILRFKAYLSERKPPLRPRTRRLALNAIRAFFHLLCQAKCLDSNPASKVYPDPLPRKIPRILTELQWLRVLDAALRKGNFAYLAVYLAGELGLRVGEIHSLLWDDVDLSDPRAPKIRIRYEGQYHVWKNRTVRGTEALTEIFEKLKEERINQKLPCRPTDRISPWQTVRPLKQLFHDIGEEAELPFRLTGKILRWRAIWRAYIGGATHDELSRRFGLSARHLEGEVLPVLRRLERQEVPV